MTDFLEKHWLIVIANLPTFVMFGFILASAGFGFARLLFSSQLEAKQERLDGAKEELQRLKDQKEELLDRLESHGESIDKIKAELDAMPKIRTSTETPDNSVGKDGDIWTQVHK